MLRWLSICLLFLSSILCAKELPDKQYLALVAEVKASPDSADYQNLRELFIQSTMYKPYSGPESELTQSLTSVMESEDWSVCVEQAETILEHNYTSLNAHYSAMACYKELKHTKKENYHKTILNNLLDVIASSGDGKSKQSAYKTISTAELRAFVQLLGYDIVNRSVEEDAADKFDVIQIRERSTGRTAKIYFNITDQWKKGTRNFEESFERVN